MTRPTILAALALVLAVAPATRAAAQTGDCHLTSLANRVLAPVDLTFPIPVGSAAAHVVVDAPAGVFLFDGGSLSFEPYFMPFSLALDTIDFSDQVSMGTIDRAGTITIPDVSFIICTQGTPAGTVCVPSNLCANDLSRICIRTAEGGVGCDPGVACQGVCSNARTRSCADDAGCVDGGACGTGTLTPFTMTLKTGTSAFGDVTVHGEPLDFASGALTLADVSSTPPESPIIGATGITSLFLSCTLDVALNRDDLPKPPCDDRQPCTADDWSVEAGCFSTPLTGVPSVSCAMEGGLVTPSCATETIPPAVSDRFDQARTLVARAGTGDRSPKAMRRLMKKAFKALKRAGKKAAQAESKGVSVECVQALGERIGEAQRRAQLLRESL